MATFPFSIMQRFYSPIPLRTGDVILLHDCNAPDAQHISCNVIHMDKIIKNNRMCLSLSGCMSDLLSTLIQKKIILRKLFPSTVLVKHGAG